MLPCDIKNVDIDVEVVEGAIQADYLMCHGSLLLNGKYSSLTHCKRYLIFLLFSDLRRMQLTLKIVSSFFIRNELF